MADRRWAIAAVLALGCGAFAVGVGHSDAEQTPEDVLDRYVELLDGGDIERAVELRCAESAIDAEQVAEFGDQVGRLRTAAGGRLRIVAMRELDEVQLGSARTRDGEREYEFTLQVGSGESARIHVVFVTEGRTWKLCGYTPAESFAITAELASRGVPTESAHIEDVRLPEDVATALNVSPSDNRAYTGTVSDEQAVEGWTTGWQRAELSGGRVTVVRFPDSRAATRAAGAQMARLAADGVELFAVPSLPQAFAVRVLGFAWTWVQPSDLGPYCESATAVFDDAVLTMGVCAPSLSTEHTELFEIVNAVLGQLAG